MATMHDLTDEDVANIKARIDRGDKYSEIASDYRINQGRIADLKFSRVRPEIKAAKLPAGFTPVPTNKKPTQLTLL
jgi:hypothetical protein